MEDIGRFLVSPLPVALLMALLAAVLRLAGVRRAALVLAGGAFALLWLCSSPWFAGLLVAHLEGRHRALAPHAAPQADAILVLGGAIGGARPPEQPTLRLVNSSTRVWYAAALHRAGKAKWIVVAAGNRPEEALEQVEADAIAEFLVQLGVPPGAIVKESASQTTRQNAALVLPVLQELQARRVLLVTSALHMPRALKTFEAVWGGKGPILIPAVTDISGNPEWSSVAGLWLPSLGALITVSKSLKEIAGMAALAIIE